MAKQNIITQFPGGNLAYIWGLTLFHQEVSWGYFYGLNSWRLLPVLRKALSSWLKLLSHTFQNFVPLSKRWINSFSWDGCKMWAYIRAICFASSMHTWSILPFYDARHTDGLQTQT